MATFHHEQSLRIYANRLADTLRDALRSDLPDDFADIFCWHARRLGPSNCEDLGQWVILECLEEKQKKGTVDGATVVRAIDRIRHRIIRRSQREAQALSEIKDASMKSGQPQVRSVESVEEIVRFALKQFTPIQLFLFEGHYLNGRGIDELATELGISRSTSYRLLSNVKHSIRAHMKHL